MPLKNEVTALHNRLLRLSRVHFWFVLAFAVQTMAFDAWKLIAPDAVLQRWLLAAGVLVATTTVWYLLKTQPGSVQKLRRMTFSLVVVDIIAISLLVYLTRGMASRAVMLYLLPILTAGALASRAALYAAALFSIAGYTTAAVAYFVLNFNEGYKIELYGEVGFYAAFMLLVAAAAWALQKSSRG